jgi:quercetin dioxygenase-like cupin family protein
MTTAPDPTDALPSDRAVPVTDLAEIGQAAIVSRVLARTSGGSITLFAFDAGQRLSEHTAPFDAIVHVIQGRLALTIDGSEVTPAPGEMVRMPAGVPHALEAIEPTHMILTMLRERQQEA